MRAMVLGVWMLATGAACAQTAQPLDLAKVTGVWFEVMRLPVKAEKKCVQESTILIATGQKKDQFATVRSCPIADAFIEVKNESGRTDTTPTGLKIRTIWPFWRHFSVLAHEPAYQWAVLATKNRKQYWVLSRAASLDSTTKNAITAQVQALGFDPAKLVMPPPATGVESVVAEAGGTPVAK